MSTSAPEGSSSGGPSRGPAPPAPTWSGPVQAVRRGLGAMLAALTTPASPAPGPGGRGRPVAYVFVVAVACVLIPVTGTELSQEYGLPGAVAVLLGFAQAGPLVLAVTRPLQAWWIVITADTLCALLLLLTPPGELSWPWPPT